MFSVNGKPFLILSTYLADFKNMIGVFLKQLKLEYIYYV